MGLTLTGFGVSPFVTAPLAEILIVRVGVQSAMAVLGIGFIVIISAFTAVFRNGPEHASGANVRQAEVEALPEMAPARMLRTASFYGLWICYVIGTLAGLTAIGMTAPFAQAVAGLSAPAAAASVAVFGIMNGVGRPLFGALHDALGTRGSVMLSFVLIAAAAVISLFAGSGVSVPFFIGFALFWLMLGGWLAIAPAATTRLFGARSYARNYGIMYTAYGVGALVGGSASGALYSRFDSYSPMFLLIIALSVVGGVVALLTLRPSKLAGG
jgi:OFA family oxalate/formate antiporter-like MFS transporter